MTKMKTLPPNQQLQISNLSELTARQRALKSSIRLQERVLREQLRVLPSEAIKAGVGHLFSGKKAGSVLPGAVAGMAVTAGTALLGSFLKKKAVPIAAGATGIGLAKSGLLALAPVLIKWLLKKKPSAAKSRG